MALKTINLGGVANDGTGDDLREAFEKVVFNFNDLDLRTPEATTVLNYMPVQMLPNYNLNH